MATRERRKGEPFTVRFDADTELLIGAEARRLKRSRSAIVEELTDEALRTRRFPGVGFRDEPPNRRAWVIGTGLDVWELCELLDQYGSAERVVKDFPLVSERHCRLASAYRQAYPDEVGQEIADNRRSPDEWLVLYPFVELAGARR